MDFATLVIWVVATLIHSPSSWMVDTKAHESVAADVTPDIEVMFVGTFHFNSSGRDLVNTPAQDILSPRKQAELEEVLHALARFRPTRIAVEVPYNASARIDSLFSAYRAQQHSLTANETQQLGFRLAAMLGHDRIHPIDHSGELPFESAMSYAAARDTVFKAAFLRDVGTLSAMDERRQRSMTLAENLIARNTPAEISDHHQMYVRMIQLGAGDSYVGADLVAKWYARNIRIYANLKKIATSGDRVLVVYGSGHVAILRQLVLADQTMRLVEPNDYLIP